MPRYDFAVIGGDRRSSCMALALARKGYSVICFNTVRLDENEKLPIQNATSLKEALENAPNVIAGIPFAKGDYLYCEECKECIRLAELQRCLRKNQKIFAGVIPGSFRRICEEREISCYDFMTDEPITLFNAVATAEGAILEALLHKDTTLHMSNALVLGYGRCAKALADKLKGLSAQVTVCSSDENELALASALGFNILSLSQLTSEIARFEYIFNTIPAQVLNGDALTATDKNSLIIDIASNKTGADYETAKTLGTRFLYCPGLPGRYAGQSCAERLARYVLSKTVKAHSEIT